MYTYALRLEYKFLQEIALDTFTGHVRAVYAVRPRHVFNSLKHEVFAECMSSGRGELSSIVHKLGPRLCSGT